MPRERERQFPCTVPSAGQGHTFYDLTALRLGETAPRPQHISCSAPVVLFGTTQEGQNMEASWQAKYGTEPAKHLRSSSRVSPGRRNASPHPTVLTPKRRDQSAVSWLARTKRKSSTCKCCRKSAATDESARRLILLAGLGAAQVHRIQMQLSFLYATAFQSCQTKE